MEKYLGNKGKWVMYGALFFSLYGALFAYIQGAGIVLVSFLGLRQELGTYIFFMVLSLVLALQFKNFEKFQEIFTSLKVIIVVIISVVALFFIHPQHLTTIHWSHFFLPYGVILFAFVGASCIPEIEMELKNNKKLLKKAIIVGSIMPIILYIIFTFVVMSVVGLGEFELLGPNQRIATVALSMYSLPWLGILANILAVLAMFTSFLTISLALIEMYHYDFGISRNIAIFLTLLLPLLAVLFNLTTFILILGVTGAITGGIDGILIILMSWKAKLLGDRKPEYFLHSHKWIGILLIVMFVFGVIYQLKVSFF